MINGVNTAEIRLTEDFLSARKTFCNQFTKIRKDGANWHFSYIQSQSSKCIYRLSTTKLCGRSGESTSVKLVHDQSNQVWAVKVIPLVSKISADDYREVQTLKKLGRFKDAVLRKLPEPKSFIINEGTKNQRTIDIRYKLYIIQHHIPGQNLLEWINVNREALMDPNNTLKHELILKIIIALGSLHQSEIIHGDVKPENIIIEEVESTFKVHFVDFGSSCILNESTNEHVCTTCRGTPGYRAPELDKANSDGKYILSWASDVYSIAVLIAKDLRFMLPDWLFEMMTHSVPQNRGGLAHLSVMILEQILYHPHTFARTSDLIKQMLACLQEVDYSHMLAEFESNQFVRTQLHKSCESSADHQVLQAYVLHPTGASAKQALNLFLHKPSGKVSTLLSTLTLKDSEYTVILKRLRKFCKDKDISALKQALWTAKDSIGKRNEYYQFMDALLHAISEIQGACFIATQLRQPSHHHHIKLK